MLSLLRWLHSSLYLLALLSCGVISGCTHYMTSMQQQAPSGAFPAHPVYVLAGRGSYNDFANNSLTILDADTWHVYRRTPLLRSAVHNFSRDPQGRIWIGYSGDFKQGDRRVQVYSAEGDWVTTLSTCLDPEAGISFAAGRAFVVCTEYGSYAAVDVFNLSTLQREARIRLEITQSGFAAMSSAATEEVVGVFGSSYLLLIDPHTLAVRDQVGMIYGATWQIMAYKGKFYLPNTASYRIDAKPPTDLAVVTPGSPSTFTTMAFARSPLWGRIVDDTLYTFHDPTWGETNNDPWRAVSKINLRTGETQTWDLPERRVHDLAIIQGKIVLALWSFRDSSRDGLYEFNPTTGSLTQLVHSIGAEKLIVVE